MKQTIIDTSYGKIMVKETAEEGYLDCYIGDNYCRYMCTIKGSAYDSEESLAESIEEYCGA